MHPALCYPSKHPGSLPRGSKSDRGQSHEEPLLLPSANSPDTFQEELPWQVVKRPFWKAARGPWHSAAPSSPGLPVPLPSVINAAICGIKTPLSYLHLAAGSRGMGRWGLKALAGSWVYGGDADCQGPACPPDCREGSIMDQEALPRDGGRQKVDTGEGGGLRSTGCRGRRGMGGGPPSKTAAPAATSSSPCGSLPPSILTCGPDASSAVTHPLPDTRFPETDNAMKMFVPEIYGGSVPGRK